MRIADLLLGAASPAADRRGTAAAQEMDVDLELVLAVDVSRSMDPAEQDLQKEGYIAALQHPEVLAAIRAGFLGRIAVTYVEWAGPGVADGRRAVDDDRRAESASGLRRRDRRAAGLAICTAPRSRARSLFAAGLFDGNGFRATRQVIDVSGDGPNNMGYPVLAGARGGARARHHHQRPADHAPRRLFRRLFDPRSSTSTTRIA